VVGVDGSPASTAALRWASGEAQLRGARLVAVSAWSYVPLASIGDPGMLSIPAGDVPGELDAERHAAETELERAFSEAFPDGVPSEIEKRLVEGDAAEALLEEGAAADLVVVGSRGRGGLASALLGSVSHHVINHAACPVVVVKAPGERG